MWISFSPVEGLSRHVFLLVDPHGEVGVVPVEADDGLADLGLIFCHHEGLVVEGFLGIAFLAAFLVGPGSLGLALFSLLRWSFGVSLKSTL